MAGKWEDPRVPKKGWVCANHTDLESPKEICEMCETQTIRYVHTMQHPDYPDFIHAGCECAAKMEDDSNAAHNRERGLKNMATRKANWSRRQWRRSRNGNRYVNVNGFNITVFQDGRGWHIRIRST